MADTIAHRASTRNALLLALAVAAGYIDALSYLGLGRVFTANMTGNTVLLAIAIAHFDADAAARSGLALAGFVAGVGAGAWIVQRDHSGSLWPRSVMVALTLEWIVLVAFAIVWNVAGVALTAWSTALLIALSAFAMGTQSAAIHRLEVSGVATTYITGTLTHLTAHLMGWAQRKGAPVFRYSALLAAVWIVYLGGAAAATVLLPFPLIALSLPAALILLVIVIASTAFHADKNYLAHSRDR
ncbi:MAG: YoaK family protein [Casimicrobiaceae bacterium]